MSSPIWTVVTENLAEQLAASQGGRVHPVQLLPFLPMSLQLIEKTLDGLITSDRVKKESYAGLTAYIFKEYIDKPPRKFAPTRDIYSDEELVLTEYTALSKNVRTQVESELGALSTSNPWPGDAVWQHELIFITQNLPDPVYLSAIAGHSRLPFRKVEEKLNTLQKLGAIQFDAVTNLFNLPPLLYPKQAFKRHDLFIRKFPGANKEETEIRLVKGLFGSFIIILVCLAIAITAKLPFPILFMGGVTASALYFLKVFKAAPKALPEL